MVTGLKYREADFGKFVGKAIVRSGIKPFSPNKIFKTGNGMTSLVS